MFYITPLDVSCLAVLGHSWLTCYNLLIDWVSSSISFRPPKETESMAPLELVTPVPLTSVPPSPAPKIAWVNAAAFAFASKLADMQIFKLFVATATPANSEPTPVNMSNVPAKYHDFKDVFNKARANTLPAHQLYDLRIELKEGTTPPFGPIYSLSLYKLQTLREFIDEHLAYRFIHPTHSPCGAPVLFIKKKNGSLQLCVDYWGLNRIMKNDRYPLPHISNLLDSPRKARLFTKIDLRHTYHLVWIHEGDKWTTAFCTCYGSFEWRVMPFSLSNAPAAFQRLMNNIFSDLLDICVLVYLDDILIYSDNSVDHKQHVREVLHRLWNNKLYARTDKCSFHQDTVEYLGYILAPSGLTTDSNKVKVIQDWPEPPC